MKVLREKTIICTWFVLLQAYAGAKRGNTIPSLFFYKKAIKVKFENYNNLIIISYTMRTLVDFAHDH